ncbi:hypothetical protein [Acidihalobacter prosperus]|uniref:Uncharacterized protein n=1 Tax=Acidihalobacter prosperus TaxID=160660 RepID=A0A1A6C0A2_9GAMM|nr:hypothetical protein [Acidihalobacter prosperus]OBS07987.1 hypothetical protein Thpro_022237 [Acidihalobacter prosperus]
MSSAHAQSVPSGTCTVAARQRRTIRLLALIGLLWAAEGWREGSGLFALGTSALAILTLAFRSALRCDRARDRVAHCWTLFGLPLWVRGRTRLTSLKAVDLYGRTRSRQDTDGDVAVWTDYYTVLKGSPTLKLRATRNDYPNARRLAERLASGLDLPLRDHVLKGVRVRRPDELDLTLGERLRRAGEPPAPPASPPPPLRLLAGGGDALALRLPAQPLSWWGYLLAVAIPAFMFTIAWFAHANLLFLIASSAFTAYFAYTLLGSFFPRRLTLDARGVTVRWYLRRLHMPWQKLEEIGSTYDGIHLLGDRKHEVLPYQFDAESSAYVRNAIAYMAWRHDRPSATAHVGG